MNRRNFLTLLGLAPVMGWVGKIMPGKVVPNVTRCFPSFTSSSVIYRHRNIEWIDAPKCTHERVFYDGQWHDNWPEDMNCSMPDGVTIKET